jgi:superfamily I DNA/RNA helicase
VIAGAGTGKTKTLAHRVAHLIVNGVDAHRILLLTFSRRAAFDMTGRVKRITAAALGTRQIDLPWAGTFHAVELQSSGWRVLRIWQHELMHPERVARRVGRLLRQQKTRGVRHTKLFARRRFMAKLAQKDKVTPRRGRPGRILSGD